MTLRCFSLGDRCLFLLGQPGVHTQVLPEFNKMKLCFFLCLPMILYGVQCE